MFQLENSSVQLPVCYIWCDHNVNVSCSIYELILVVKKIFITQKISGHLIRSETVQSAKHKTEIYTFCS